MLGVVALLDEQSSSFIRNLWEALSREFGPGGMTAGSAPHVSFHVAEQYNVAGLEARVKSLARSLPPFTTKTAGIGVFPGAEHVIHLPVVRTARLTVVHRVITDEIQGEFSGGNDFYLPDCWVPHVTLGRWPAEREVAAGAVRFLASRDLDRVLALDNLALLEEGAETRSVHFVHRLSS